MALRRFRIHHHYLHHSPNGTEHHPLLVVVGLVAIGAFSLFAKARQISGR